MLRTTADVLARLTKPLRATYPLLVHRSISEYETDHALESTHRRSLALIFAGLGLHIGVWAVLLADLSFSLGIGPGPLGLALAALSCSGIVSLVLGGRIADRVGRRPILFVGIAGTGMLFVWLAVVGSYTALLVAFVVGGLATSFYDLTVNTLGGDFERQHNTRIMTRLHAVLSGAAALSALGCGIALSHGFGFRLVYVVSGIALLLLAALVLRLPLPHHIHKPGDGTASSSQGRPGFTQGVTLAAALVGLAFVTDSALDGYASIYLRDILDSGALLGGAGIAAYHTAGMVGRLAGTARIERVGERSVLRTAGIGAALGTAIVVAAQNPVVAAVGLLIVGGAQSLIAPIAFSLAARSSPGHTARAISVVTGVGYFAFLVAPAAVGSAAERSSLRTTLAFFIVTSLGVALLAHRRL